MDLLSDDLLNQINAQTDSDTLMVLRVTCRRFHHYVLQESTLIYLICHHRLMKKFYSLEDFSPGLITLWDYLDVYNSTFLSKYNHFYYTSATRESSLFQIRIQSGEMTLDELSRKSEYGFQIWDLEREIIRSDQYEIINRHILDRLECCDLVDCLKMMIHLTTSNSKDVIELIFVEFSEVHADDRTSHYRVICSIVMYTTAHYLVLDFLEPYRCWDYYQVDIKSMELHGWNSLFDYIRCDPKILSLILSSYNGITNSDPEIEILEHCAWLHWTVKISLHRIIAYLLLYRKLEIINGLLETYPTDPKTRTMVFNIMLHLPDNSSTDALQDWYQLCEKSSVDIILSIGVGMCETTRLRVYKAFKTLTPNQLINLASCALTESNFLVARWIQLQDKKIFEGMSDELCSFAMIRKILPFSLPGTDQVIKAIALSNSILIEYLLDRVVDGSTLDWKSIVERYIELCETDSKVFELGHCLRHHHQIYDPVGAALVWDYKSAKVRY
ncbi:Hypothetical protein POVR1_LOCUS56 [uncultured virus]|nr:Hypothetical protein POVR1_LOCUS56 [uncultured virus]